MTRWVRFGLGAALVVAGAIVGLRSETLALAANPIISITPAQQTAVTTDASVAVQINVQDTADIASYNAVIVYDPYVLQFVSATNGTFVTKAAIPDLFCFPAVDNAGGAKYPGLRYASYGCASRGGTGDVVQGAGLLATFTFKPIGGGTSDLSMGVTDQILMTPLGNGVCEDPRLRDEKTRTPLQPPCVIHVNNASITVDGPVLARPTPDPNATPTVRPTLPTATPVAGAPATGTTPASGSAAASTSAGANGTPGAAASGGVVGANSSSGVAGAPTGGIAGADARPGSAGARAGSSGAPGASGTGVGRFGDGPQSYARDGAGQYRNSAVAFAALGLVLIAAGVWRGGRGDAGSRG